MNIPKMRLIQRMNLATELINIDTMHQTMKNTTLKMMLGVMGKTEYRHFGSLTERKKILCSTRSGKDHLKDVDSSQNYYKSYHNIRTEVHGRSSTSLSDSDRVLGLLYHHQHEL